MNNVIDEIVSQINSHDDWTKNEKIRYAYIKLGENVHLNAKFFYSLYGIMDEDIKYSVDELRKIYSQREASYYVICRDCAYMLKMILDRCNINSEIKETCEVDHYDFNGELFDVQHFFVCAEGDNNKKYFLSLVLDIPYIQFGMETEHFATNVVYRNDKGEQVYNGPVVHNTVMSKQEIRKLDEKIGYLSFSVDDNKKKEYFNEAFTLLKNANKRYKEYLYTLITSGENEFYNGLVDLISEDNESISFDFSKATMLKIYEIKEYVCRMIKDKIFSDLNINIDMQTETAMESLLVNRMYKKYIEILNKMIKDNAANVKNTEFSLYALTTSAPKLFETLDDMYYTKDYKSKDFKKLKERFNIYVTKIATVFVDKKYQPSYNGTFSNEYLIKKIKVLFPKIFDFGHDTKFTHMEVGEKSTIIKRIMNTIFQELSKDTSKRNVENPVENRIKPIMMYDKYDNEYKVLILINPTSGENYKALIYNFNDGKNYFENEQSIPVFSLLANTKRYVILSEKLQIRAQENVEKRNVSRLAKYYEIVQNMNSSKRR